MEHMRYDRGFVTVKRMPSDGHCLFSALICQFYKTECDDPAHPQRVTELRKQVVAYIKSNMENFRESLMDTVGVRDYLGHDADTRVQEFLRRLEESNEWGGEESVAAAANIFKRRIDVYCEDGGIITFNRSDTARGVLRIAYRAATTRESRAERRIERVHYDSIIQRLWPPRIHSEENQETVSGNNFVPPSSQIHEFQRNVDDSASQIINTETANIEIHPANEQQDKFKFLSWNARGCSDSRKRNEMDNFFMKNNYMLIALQETRIAECTLETSNYYWFNVNVRGAKNRVGGGTAILVRKSLLEENRFRKISDNSCSLLVNIFGQKVVFISCYVRSDINNGNSEFGRMSQYLISLPDQIRQNVIIAGDLNAHIGTQDKADVDKAIIGNNLLHQYCNANGLELKAFLHGARLKNYLSFSSSPSVKITWTNGRSTSQLDHVLMTVMKFMKIPRIRAFFDSTIRSDHKMVECDVIHNASTQQMPNTNTRSCANSSKRIKFDLELLKDEEQRAKFQQCMDRLTPHGTSINSTSDQKWGDVASAVLGAAKATLQSPGSPPTPRRQQAHKRSFIAQQKHLANRDNPILKKEAKEAAKQKRVAYEQHFAEKVDKFLNSIEEESPLAKMTKTFRFIKSHRRQRETKKRKYINIQQWEQKLASSTDRNPTVSLLPEDDGRSPGPEPTKEEILEILWSTRNNSAPGLDNINNELLKHASEKVHDELTKMMKEIFRTNNVPKDWSNTVQVPIPKTPNAATTDDYRCITLCPSAYKIYAKILLKRLRDQIDPLPSYQMAFQAKRSATDQIFVLRRILDERWRKGVKTIVVSIDLKQAFDKIDTSKAADILDKLGVSRALINRIIKACLNENTSIQWFGQRTTTRKKQRGIKQGCPLSPELFILMLHYVLKQLQEEWPDIRLEHGNDIRLPCILCYADDILFLCENEEDVERLLDLLIPLLESVGLEINTSKTKILFRDPYDIANVAPDSKRKFGKYELVVVTIMRYLGAYITSSLSRGSTTSERIKKSYKAFFHLCSFLRKHKLSWPTVKRLYHSLITPVATYGMEVSTILKSNRNSLRRMENEMIMILKDLCKKDREENINQEESTNGERDTVADEVTTEQSGQAIQSAVQNVESENNERWNENPHIAPNWLNNVTINNKIRTARLNFFGHVIRSNQGGILKNALEYKIPKPKKVGKPAYSWRNCIWQDIERSGIPIEGWHEAALDKQKLKNLTKSLYNNMVESEYEISEDSDDNSSDDSLLPSDFAGFSDEGEEFAGFSD